MYVYSVGCSFTEGTGVLSGDTYTRLINMHFNPGGWNYADYEYAQAGHGNQYIFRTAIEIAEKMDKENDVLIVQWSSPFRQELMSKEEYAFTAPFDFVNLAFKYGNKNKNFFRKNLETASIDDEFKIADDKYKDFVKQYSDNFMSPRYMEIISFSMQVSLYHLLNAMGIKSIQFYGWEGCKIKEKNIYNFIPENGNFLKESFETFCIDNGEVLINEHPSKRMHDLFHTFLLNKMKEFNYINLNEKL
jgi:hypothetical protein